MVDKDRGKGREKLINYVKVILSSVLNVYDNLGNYEL